MSVLNVHWRDWCWSWSSNTLATWWEELTLWKGPWCWKRLKAGGEGDDRGDGRIGSSTQWTWIWASSGKWWRTGKPSMLQPMGSQRVDKTEGLDNSSPLTELYPWTRCRASLKLIIFNSKTASSLSLLHLPQGSKVILFVKNPWTFKCVKNQCQITLQAIQLWEMERYLNQGKRL